VETKEVKETEVSIVIILIIIMTGAIMSVINSSIVNVALATISGNLGASTTEIASISTIYILANVLIMPLNGYLTSLFGRKYYYAISLAIFTISSLLCSMAWNLDSLVIFRFMQGLGGGALMPTAQAIIFEIFPKEKHGRAMALFGVAVMVAPTVAPTLGGWLIDNYNWHFIFNINILPGIFATIMTLIFIKTPDYVSKPEGRFDFIGLSSLIIGLSSLQFILEKGQENDWFESNLILFMTLTSIIFIIFFIYWELNTKNPIVDLSVFKDRTFTFGNIVGIVNGFGLYGVNLIFPLFLSSILGFNAFQTGMIILPGAIATAVGMPISGFLADKIDPRISIFIGLLFYAGSTWSLGSLTTQSGYWDLFLPRIVQGFALAMLFVPLSKITMSQIPREKMANASGLYSLLRQLGGSVGIAILTTLLANYTKLEYAHLAEYVNTFNPQAVQKLQVLQGFMMSKGISSNLAYQQALMMLKGSVQKQGLMLAYNNLFKLTSVIFIVCIFLVIFLKNKKVKK